MIEIDAEEKRENKKRIELEAIEFRSRILKSFPSISDDTKSINN